MQGFPQARAGQVIGLLGGSFDPAHHGHVQLSKFALKRFDLDQVWWLVSPANPLKEHAPQSLEHRLNYAQNLIQHPRIKVTNLEQRLQTTYTAHTLKALQAYYCGVRFMWLMGADNLRQFHKWHDWQSICEAAAIGVFARPNEGPPVRGSKMMRMYRSARLSSAQSRELKSQATPAWCFVNMPLCTISSTQIRNNGHWPKPSSLPAR